MSRAVTLTGYVVLAAALGLRQIVALRSRRRRRHARLLTFGELLLVAVRRSGIRWPLLAGWLWLGGTCSPGRRGNEVMRLYVAERG